MPFLYQRRQWFGKRADTYHIPVFNVNILLEKQRNNIQIPLFTSEQQRRPIIIVFSVGICAISKKFLNKIESSFLRSVYESCSTILQRKIGVRGKSRMILKTRNLHRLCLLSVLAYFQGKL